MSVTKTRAAQAKVRHPIYVGATWPWMSAAHRWEKRAFEHHKGNISGLRPR